MSKKQSLIGFFALAAVLIVFYILKGRVPQADTRTTERQQVTDLAGRSVQLDKNIKRIILLRSKDIYELAPLLEDELSEKLIAWGPDLRTDDAEAYKKFIAKFPALVRLTETGSIYNDALSVEQLVSLNPDLVIADKFILDRGYKYAAKMQEAGLPVVYLDGSNNPLTGSQRGIELLGLILGKRKRAEQIVTFVDQQFDAVLSKLKNLNEPIPSVYLEQGLSGPTVFGATYGSSGNPPQYTSWGKILQELKVRNIADGIVGKQEPVHPEFILKENPDIIVITGQNWVSTPGVVSGSMRLGYNVALKDAHNLLQGFTIRAGWPELKAVKNHRVYSVFHNTAVITCFSAVQSLAKDIYPQVFKDLDPKQNLREFYRRFMPIDNDGTWAVSLR